MSTTRRSAEAAESILARIREWAENPNKTDNPYREGFSDAKRSVLTLLAGESPRSSNPLADQDHGLDDVRELARGLRENPGETREGVRRYDWRTLGELLSDPSVEGMEFIARTDVAELEARADRLEAALERVREWAEGFLRSKNDRNQSVGREVLSLIEHGPDDGLSGRGAQGEASVGGASAPSGLKRLGTAPPAEPDDGESG